MGHPVAGNGRVEAISRGLADAIWVAQIATTSCEGTKSALPKKECINPLAGSALLWIADCSARRSWQLHSSQNESTGWGEYHSEIEGGHDIP